MKSCLQTLPTLAVIGCSLAQWTALHGEEPGLGALPPLPQEQLSDRAVSRYGEHALSIRPGDWLHAETENFIYHYLTSFIATPVSVEAEYYYRVIAADLEKSTADWERKGHIFIFDQREDWQAFLQVAELDPWTGGMHRRNELFILRNREDRWKGHALGHEVAHLVVDRFFGSNVPLWLNEGYAEYSSRRAYAAYFRARGYQARPRSPAVNPEHYIPLEKLFKAVEYPSGVNEIRTFYIQSERLVRFLSRESKSRFLELMNQLARGARIESALHRAYGGRFPTLNALDREFHEYATADYGTTLQQR